MKLSSESVVSNTDTNTMLFCLAHTFLSPESDSSCTWRPNTSWMKARVWEQLYLRIQQSVYSARGLRAALHMGRLEQSWKVLLPIGTTVGEQLFLNHDAALTRVCILGHNREFGSRYIHHEAPLCERSILGHESMLENRCIFGQKKRAFKSWCTVGMQN